MKSDDDYKNGEDKLKKQDSEEEVIRVKTPNGKQVIGILEQRMGASRMRVRCLDGVTRLCRVPGRLKRKLWIREGDIILVEPWEYDNKRGDIIFKYKPTHIEWLKSKGYLKNIDDFQEF